MLNKLKLKAYRHQNNQRQSNDLQIFDLLQLSRTEREYKILCRDAIQKFSEWKKQQRHKKNVLLRRHTQTEGILLRRKAQDAAIMYRLIKHNRIKIFQGYIARLPEQKGLFRALS